MPSPSPAPSFEQLDLDFGLLAKRPWPALGTKLRVYYKHTYREWPGGPSQEMVTVYDGTLHVLIRAGENPHTRPDAVQFYGPRARPSKYDRIVLALNSMPPVTRYRALTMHKQYVWVLYSEAESS